MSQEIIENVHEDNPVENQEKHLLRSSTSSISSQSEYYLNTFLDYKIFVGGLSQDTTEEDLKQYFKQFGEPKKCTIKYNNDSKVSREFGFVTFTDERIMNKVLEVDEHIIKEKKVDCKLALTKEEALKKTKAQINQNRKLYVRNIPPHQKKRDLKDFFKTYGKVEDVNLIYKNKESKGFAFIVFSSRDSAEKVLETPELEYKESKLIAQIAIPKDRLESERFSQYNSYSGNPQNERTLLSKNSFNSIGNFEEGYNLGHGPHHPGYIRQHPKPLDGGYHEPIPHSVAFYPKSTKNTSLADISTQRATFVNSAPTAKAHDEFIECPNCQALFQPPPYYRYVPHPSSLRSNLLSYEDMSSRDELNYGPPRYAPEAFYSPQIKLPYPQYYMMPQQKGLRTPAPRRTQFPPQSMKPGLKNDKFNKYLPARSSTIREDEKGSPYGS